MNSHEFETVRPDQKVLTPDEKMFLLTVERGDLAYVKKIVQALGKKKQIFDLNCTDPLGRSALVIAIENENIELIQYLLEAGIDMRDSLLIAIREDYVDGVDCLLRFEEEHHKAGEPYSWEKIDQVTANFTPDMTPLILAAQRNNYEILKMLLDRGATIPMPHDVKCSCDECVEESSSDSLRFSLSRINAYKALASPSLIALSSKDPILTAFELSNELKKLSLLEAQFREEFQKLRKQVQSLATGLVDHARTSYELEVLLNHNPEGNPWIPGETQTLERLKLAIDYNQKRFVTHPSVQQLLAALWYEGLPGFRRLHIFRQILCVLRLSLTFPIYALAYLFCPKSSWGKFAKKPFVKFICNSASYIFFLGLLAMASQRVEYIVIDIIVYLIPGTEFLAEIKAGWLKHERGSLPTIVEMLVILWVQALILKELQCLYREGLWEYLSDMWNLADIFSYGAFMNWIGLRALSWFMVHKEIWEGKDPDEVWIPRSQWKPFDPYLLAEGMFGAGMISSFLKVIHIFSINPYLGPLQVSLGKMVLDIAKWLVLYVLVLFSFGCGLNQLLWYYADLEKQQCYSLPGGLPDFENYGDSCVMWRRFANLWETSQSLFWASFGLVELGDFELKGIKEFTRFWGLLMFGSYSVCNIIVLLNMLIAMMSNSYTIISQRSDMEWKFARSKLWISYFGSGGTVAAPFNLIPMPRAFLKVFKCCKKKINEKDHENEKKKADDRYYGVVSCMVRRYVTDEQRKAKDYNITEDDINEVRQDIRSFRFELINILKMNDMKTPQVKESAGKFGRKSKDLERMIQKGFQISKTEGVIENVFGGALASIKKKTGKANDKFKKLAFAAVKNEKKNWNERVRQSSIKQDPIGSTETSVKRRTQSFRRSMLARGNSMEEINVNLRYLNAEQLVNYNPLLIDYTPATRIAYARFKSGLTDILEPKEGENGENEKKTNGELVAIENENMGKKSPGIRGARSPKGQREEKSPKTSSKVTQDVHANSKDEVETDIYGLSKDKEPIVSEAAQEMTKDHEEMIKKEEELLENKEESTTPKKESEVVDQDPIQKSPAVSSSKGSKCDEVLLQANNIFEPDIKTPPSRKSSTFIEQSMRNATVEEMYLDQDIKITVEDEGNKKLVEKNEGGEIVEESLVVKVSGSSALPDSNKSSPRRETARSPAKAVIEPKKEDPQKEEPVKFDPRGKSISTGRNITGWL